MALDTRLKLELPVLLPQVDDERDACVDRLRDTLARQRGIDRVHLDRQAGRAVLCLHYRPEAITLAAVRRIALRAGAAISRQIQHGTVHIGGMDCADCAVSLEHVLGRMPGVLTISVSYPAEKMRLEFDASRIRLNEIARRVSWMGYGFDAPARPARWPRRHAALIASLASGVFMAAGLVGPIWLGLPPAAANGLFGLAYLAGGLEAARHGVAAALRLRFDIDFLMVIAAAGAAVLGHWAEGAFLLFFFSLGHALEQRALGRARHNVEAMRSFMPHAARVRRDGAEMERPVDDLLRGDHVVVRPGERLPVDGRILQGITWVDQAPVTGESRPIERRPGDDVFAGSVNGQAAVVVEVTRLARDSTLSRVVQMVEEAQAQKSSVQRLTERFSRVYVPLVLGGSVLAAVIPPALGWLPPEQALLRALTLLVAASPCALAISTPAAVLSAVARAARSGILVKGGRQLEQLGRISAVAFDKTGTLTQGRMSVTDVEAFAGAGRAEVLAVAAAVEAQLVHPLARAVAQAAAFEAVPVPLADGVEASGGGVKGRVEGVETWLGSPAWLMEHGMPLPDEAVRAVARHRAEGHSLVLVARRGTVLGLIGLTDRVRPEAAGVLHKLASMGVAKRVMLTGDHTSVARPVAEALELTGFQADLLPADKVEAVRRLGENGSVVAMVGDGVNDAPAMAQAGVGIALGGAASDVARETADVVLMADDLRALPLALEIGRQSRRVMAQNLVLSLGVIAGLLVGAAAGWASIGPAIVLHEGSTLLVVFNSLRLLRAGATDRP